MARGRSSWNKFAAPYMRRSPRTGLREASAAWRGERSNPGMGKLFKYGLIAGAVYYGYKTFMAPKPPAEEPKQNGV